MRCQRESDVASDAELLVRFRTGEEAALGELYQRYEGPVFRFLLGMLRDRHQAEDALQETFIQAVRKSDRADPAMFRGWLFTVAHQQGILLKRKEKKFATSGLDAAMGIADRVLSPIEALCKADDVRAVTAILNDLPPHQQTVIRLRFFEGLKFQQIASQLGLPIGTALARLHDGLKAMRLRWEEQHA